MDNNLAFYEPPVSWTPHHYQKQAMKFLIEHAAGALLLDPGLGKTSITLGALKVLMKRGLVQKTLIIAPLRVCQLVWPVERDKWKDFSGLRIEVLHGPDKDKALRRDADIYVINPEGLDWLLGTEKSKSIVRRRNFLTGEVVDSTKTAVKVDVRAFKKLGFDTLIIDELTRFKSASSLRFKALIQVHKTFGRRWGLTGSPAANGLLDLFGQFYILDEGRSLGKYVTHYRNKYFNRVNTFAWAPMPGAEEHIYKAIEPLSLRMAAKDLPELVYNTIKLELPELARQVYDALEEDLMVMIDNKRVVAANAAVMSGKCRQVANGGLYADPELVTKDFKLPKAKRDWWDLHTEKVDAIESLVEELQGSPLLVAYEFNHDLARIQAKFGKDVPYIGKGVSLKRAKELVNLWNAGKLPLLFGNPQAMGHGLNMQEVGRHVVWHSLTWDYELYDQFIRRVLRQGNKHSSVVVHHLVMRNTIDEAVLLATKRKGRGQQALFDALIELKKSRKKY